MVLPTASSASGTSARSVAARPRCQPQGLQTVAGGVVTQPRVAGDVAQHAAHQHRPAAVDRVSNRVSFMTVGAGNYS